MYGTVSGKKLFQPFILRLGTCCTSMTSGSLYSVTTRDLPFSTWRVVSYKVVLGVVAYLLFQLS